MPELPEVETVCRTIEPLLRGRAFVGFELSWPRTLAHPDPSTFTTSIVGHRIIAVSRRAKLILIHLDDDSAISVHLRMTGQLRVLGVDDIPQPSSEAYLRASFALDDGTSLDFSDVRKFGRIKYSTSTELDDLNLAYGVEPLTAEFTAARRHALLRSRSRSINALLLDQTIVAGLGNIYVDEALFQSGIHPLTKSDQISTRKSARLRDAIVDILNGSISRHGTTLRDYRSGLGDEGSNQSFLRIYGLKAGHPCTVCSTPVERCVIAQRGTVFCPRCQPKPRRACTRRQSVPLPRDRPD